jgi:hypothetical protein
MGKKRKADCDSHTLYSSFVEAASAVTKLYAQASQTENSTRQTLERLITTVYNFGDGQPYISKAHVLDLLHHELHSLSNSTEENTKNMAFPQLAFPVVLPQPQSHPTGFDSETEETDGKEDDTDDHNMTAYDTPDLGNYLPTMFNAMAQSHHNDTSNNIKTSTCGQTTGFEQQQQQQ